MIYQDLYQSPIGRLQMLIEDDHLIALQIHRIDGYVQETTPFSNQIKKALEGYFYHKEKTFNIPMRFKGSPFQMKMYDALIQITYGQTTTYGHLASMMGNSSATRAVGQALHNNPIMIFMPCHRIIGKNKRLTGYAGGLEVKKYLLDHEAKNMI